MEAAAKKAGIAEKLDAKGTRGHGRGVESARRGCKWIGDHMCQVVLRLLL